MEKFEKENKIKSYDQKFSAIIDRVKIDYNSENDIYQLWAEYEGYKVHIVLNKDAKGEIKFKIVSIENMKSKILEPNETNVKLPEEIQYRINDSVKKFIKSFLSYKPIPKNVRKPYKDD